MSAECYETVNWQQQRSKCWSKSPTDTVILCKCLVNRNLYLITFTLFFTLSAASNPHLDSLSTNSEIIPTYIYIYIYLYIYICKRKTKQKKLNPLRPCGQSLSPLSSSAPLPDAWEHKGPGQYLGMFLGMCFSGQRTREQRCPSRDVLEPLFQVGVHCPKCSNYLHIPTPSIAPL